MRVAVLGAGLLGVCTALELADRGDQVTLIDQRDEPLTEASFHNEGKIHLGFVYAADPTFRTAHRMIGGAARFLPVLARWMPSARLDALKTEPFDYVVHRDTMISVDNIEAHFARVATTIRQVESGRGAIAARDASRPIWRRLTPRELDERYDSATALAAYETCERGMDVWGVAGSLREAVDQQPHIEFAGATRVHSVRTRADGRHDVVLDSNHAHTLGPFDGIVNALWANRRAIDERTGVTRPGRWFTRRKLGVHVFPAATGIRVPTVTIMLGPFGDIVTYGSGRVYLSWYPTCLIGTSTTSEETDWSRVLASVDRAAVYRGTMDGLAEICPAVRRLPAFDGTAIVNGGSICAEGHSDIDDPQSQLHERIDSGTDGRGTYLSVDTAKYTMAPAIAERIADRLTTLKAV